MCIIFIFFSSFVYFVGRKRIRWNLHFDCYIPQHCFALFGFAGFFSFVRSFVCQTRSQFIEGRIVELPLHAKPCLLCERVKCRFAGDLTACVLSLSPTLSLFSLFRKDECSQIQQNTSTVRAKCKCFQPEQWTVCSDTQLFFSNDFTQLWFTL